MTNTRHAGLFSRRRFLKTSAGAAFMAGATLPTPAISQGATKIKMTLPWLPQGAQLFPFIARNKGYWRSRGLEVEIARGFGSGAGAESLMVLGLTVPRGRRAGSPRPGGTRFR